MRMSDLVKECNCKYCSWSNGTDPNSCTAWLVCKLKDDATDVDHCKECGDRVPKSIERR